MVVYIPNQWFISIVLRSDGYNSYLVHLIYIYIYNIYISLIKWNIELIEKLQKVHFFKYALL